MADTANVDLILEKSFDARTSEERLKIKTDFDLKVREPQKKSPFSCLGAVKSIGSVYYQSSNPNPSG